MEKLVNCEITVSIESIDKIIGSNQLYEIFFTSEEKRKYKIVFDFVWDIRFSIENAYIERASKFCHCERERKVAFS